VSHRWKHLPERPSASQAPGQRRDGGVPVVLLALFAAGYPAEQVWHVMLALAVLYMVLRGLGDGR